MTAPFSCCIQPKWGQAGNKQGTSFFPPSLLRQNCSPVHSIARQAKQQIGPFGVCEPFNNSPNLTKPPPLGSPLPVKPQAAGRPVGGVGTHAARQILEKQVNLMRAEVNSRKPGQHMN